MGAVQDGRHHPLAEGRPGGVARYGMHKLVQELQRL